MRKARFCALSFLAATIILVVVYLNGGYPWANALSQISFLLFGIYTGEAWAYGEIANEIDSQSNG